MAATKRVRWECPNEIHPAVLGSSRPALDSIVRYCMPCSMASGKLEKRVAPALESKRTKAAEAAAIKAKAKRAREAKAKVRAKEAEKARYTVEGVDLRDEMRKLMKLKAWKQNGRYRDGFGKRVPELVISRRTSYPRSRLGFAEAWRWRITIATYPGITLAQARETLVHEMTHLAVGYTSGHAKYHGPEFRATMTAAFKEAYKVLPIGIGGASYGGGYAAALRKKEQG